MRIDARSLPNTLFLLALGIALLSGGGQAASSGSNTSTAPHNATCSAKPINYITHGLPQQCLDANLLAASRARLSDSLNVSTTSLPHSSKASATSRGTYTTATDTAQADSQKQSGHPHQQITTTDDVNTAPPEEHEPSVYLSNALPEATPNQFDTETDSPLDNAKFLSFEEWKKENLAQSGQSAENLGQGRNPAPNSERKRPSNEALEGFGEDSEIEIDFSGFRASSSPGIDANVDTDRDSWLVASQSANVEAVPTASHMRNKDAGKTCKERFNYASFDCAANVLKTNPECKSSSAVLVENKDSYMLNICSASNKFIIIELCDDILIDTIVLANFEFFSSIFRTFKVSVSDRYPVKIDRWKNVGTFEARNTRDIQAFLIENPPIWARYVRVEFLSHYGSEYYCPVSLVRVHGTTMMEEFRHQEALARGEIDIDDEDDEKVESQALQIPLSVQTDDTARTSPSFADAPPASTKVGVLPTTPTEAATMEPTQSTITLAPESSSPPASQSSSNDTCALSPVQATYSPLTQIELGVCGCSESPIVTHMPQVTDPKLAASRGTDTDASHATANAPSAHQSSRDERDKSESISHYSKEATRSQETNSDSSPVTTLTSSQKLVATPITAPVFVPAPGPPATQDSFFKAVHKRLLALEANATLSLQYIESQSQLLRDAFAKVEKRQLHRAATFLDNLNATVLSELKRFKDEYEQLWQSTVLELSSQREEGRRERELLGERLKVLAEEMVSQKRLMAAQATLLLLCLGLVLFARMGGSAAAAGAVDIGLAHGLQEALLSKARGNSTHTRASQSGKWQWESPWASPPMSPQRMQSGAGSNTRRVHLHHRRANSELDGSTRIDVGGEAASGPEDLDDSRGANASGGVRLTQSAPLTPGSDAGEDPISGAESPGEVD